MALTLPLIGKRRRKPPIERYGGGLMPAVIGPSTIRRKLERLSLIRATLTAAIAFLTIANAVFVLVLVGRLDTQLYVADGTPFGCPVEELGS